MAYFRQFFLSLRMLVSYTFKVADHVKKPNEFWYMKELNFFLIVKSMLRIYT